MICIITNYCILKTVYGLKKARSGEGLDRMAAEAAIWIKVRTGGQQNWYRPRALLLLDWRGWNATLARLAACRLVRAPSSIRLLAIRAFRAPKGNLDRRLTFDRQYLSGASEAVHYNLSVFLMQPIILQRGRDFPCVIDQTYRRARVSGNSPDSVQFLPKKTHRQICAQ